MVIIILIEIEGCLISYRNVKLINATLCFKLMDLEISPNLLTLSGGGGFFVL